MNPLDTASTTVHSLMRVGGYLLAIPEAQMKQVQPLYDLQFNETVSHAEGVLGTETNLSKNAPRVLATAIHQGQKIPVFALDSSLRLSTVKESESRFCACMGDSHGFNFGLMVSAVEPLILAGETRISPAPDCLGYIANLCDGFIWRDKEVVMLTSVQKLKEIWSLQEEVADVS